MISSGVPRRCAAQALIARREEGEALPTTLEGGCLCGALRYEVRGEPVTVALCHCSMCRRSAGAPLVAWAMFERDAFAFTQGKPAVVSCYSEKRVRD